MQAVSPMKNKKMHHFILKLAYLNKSSVSSDPVSSKAITEVSFVTVDC